MWRILKHFRESGVHFRRQVHIGTYYVDFACLNPSLAIEVDGSTHGHAVAQSNDAVRDDYLRGRGFRVLRVWNGDVLRNPESVHHMVALELADISRPASPPTPDPSPQGGGELA
jgi:very-short-patch-repair endonuclease